MKQNCEDAFTTYRYYKPKYHFCQKITTKVNVCHEDKTMCFSFAICNEEDNFSREHGRVLTDARMDKGFFVCGNYDAGLSLFHNCSVIVEKTIEDIENGKFTFPEGVDPKKYEQELRRFNEAVEQVTLNMMIEDASSQLYL